MGDKRKRKGAAVGFARARPASVAASTVSLAQCQQDSWGSMQHSKLLQPQKYFKEGEAAEGEAAAAVASSSLRVSD